MMLQQGGQRLAGDTKADHRVYSCNYDHHVLNATVSVNAVLTGKVQFLEGSGTHADELEQSQSPEPSHLVTRASQVSRRQQPQCLVRCKELISALIVSHFF